MTYAPTPEQAAILAEANSPGNLMISALAGTGKTTTLEMLDLAIKRQPHLYLVFNKANATAAEKRMSSTTTVKTFNGLGHRIWAPVAGGNLKLDTRKQNGIFKAITEDAKKAERDAYWQSYELVMSGVNLARALGYIPARHPKGNLSLLTSTAFHSLLEEEPNDLEADLIDAVLVESIQLAFEGTIDFNDQIYMPAFFGGTFPRFPVVLIDEYQDLSPVNHLMVEKLTKESRQIGVGDDAQSIYGFRGAKAGGMGEATRKYNMGQLPLSISFRCPTAIVENVHWRVPAFRAFRNGGTVNAPERFDLSHLPSDAVIICRNNAPLMRTAFGLILAGHSVSVAGTDIGPRIVATLRKLGPESLTQGQTLSAINDWLEAKLAKESKTAEDFAACMRIFAQQATSLGSAIAYAEHLFAQTGTIRLMTGHKAKGLEFDHVYHLDQWIIRDHIQDRNLRYVIDTRAKESLTYIDTDKINWS